jgi:hypothetical protein
MKRKNILLIDPFIHSFSLSSRWGLLHSPIDICKYHYLKFISIILSHFLLFANFKYQKLKYTNFT